MSGCNDTCCSEERPMADLLRELGRFSRSWNWGSLIADRLDRPLVRADMHRALIARVLEEPALTAYFRASPRYAYMLAVYEAFEISKLDFLRQIREVRLLAETPGMLYLVLPGQAELEARLEGRDGGGNGAASEAASAATRQTIERQLIAKAVSDTSFRDSLLFEPNAAYRTAARALCGGAEPDYLRPVREIRVVPEDSTSLAMVVPETLAEIPAVSG